MNKIIIKTDATVPYVSGVLPANGIGIYDVKTCVGGCIFSVKEKDFYRCKDVLAQREKKVEVVKERSFRVIKEIIFLRFGLILGIITIMAAIFLYSSAVLRLQVEGNELVSTEVIAEAVKAETLLPAMKMDVDVKKIRTAVCLLPGVSNASVMVSGTTLKVTVLEELAPVEREAGDIVSSYDALITKVIVYEGEEAVKVGDAVKKGDILLKTNEKGVARGEIFGRVWLNEHIVVPAERIVTYRTGRVETVYSFIGSKLRYGGKFSSYEVVREEVWLPLAVPVKVCKTTFYEVEQRQEKVDFEKEKERLISASFDRMERQLQGDREKAEKWFFVKTVDKTTVLDLYYEQEVRISN